MSTLATEPTVTRDALMSISQKASRCSVQESESCGSEKNFRAGMTERLCVEEAFARMIERKALGQWELLSRRTRYEHSTA